MSDPRNPVKKIYRAIDGIVTSADAMVIEYYDCIRPVWFNVLQVVVREKLMREYFDMSMFDEMTDGDLYEWYVHRTYRNPFLNIPPKATALKDNRVDYCNKLLWEFCQFKEFYQFPHYLNLEKVLKNLVGTASTMVKHIYVYEGPNQNPYIEEQVTYNLRPKTIDYIHGSFDRAIQYLPKNTTYILSDLHKLKVLEQQERIQTSTILLVDGWRYNSTPKGPNKLVVDVQELRNKHTCYIEFFNDLYQGF